MPGSNQIEIKVTNLWVNRLIGDQQPWSLRNTLSADFTPYKADSPLLPSGLLGSGADLLSSRTGAVDARLARKTLAFCKGNRKKSHCGIPQLPLPRRKVRQLAGRRSS